ncbi:hypothetical protein NE237_004693 [Protea cynaroides]|uniref:HIG1 domain-containing protein n=1 Tax=Protea cynaroides TaxID=273540 RepID=A0A9Q0QTX4_9MAGN|nr:hypothetical protein NE237_004693 [Protea cynaroides]
MDYSICSPVSLILRHPRNSICQACYDGAKSIISFFNKFQHNRDIGKFNFSDLTQSNSYKGIANALKWVEEMKESEEGLNEKLKFLSGLLAVFQDGTHADIQVKPDNGSSILAHRAIRISFLAVALSIIPFPLQICTSLLHSALKKMESLRSWVSENKLASIGTLWATAVGASLAYTHSRSPLKPSLRLIHARMHAQALTLAVLSGAAILHHFDDNKPRAGQDGKKDHRQNPSVH